MANNYASVPIRDAAAVPDPDDRTNTLARRLPKLVLSTELTRWLSGLSAEVSARPRRHIHVRLTAQTASIGATALGIDTVSSGLWRISVQVRVSTAGSVSSEILVTIAWTQGAVAQSESTANLTGNLTTTREGRTVVLRADQATPITYATTYVDGGGATAMQYELDVAAEEVVFDD